MFGRRISLLAKKITIAVVGISLILTAVFSAWELQQAYSAGVKEVEGRFQSIEKTYLPSLSSALWHMDRDQINLVFKGIKAYPDVSFISISSKTRDMQFVDGDIPSDHYLAWTKKIEYTSELGVPEQIGEIQIMVSLESLKKRTLNLFWSIWFTQVIRTLVFAVFLLFIVNKLVISRLAVIEDYLRKYDLSKSNQDLIKLDLNESSPDEITFLAHSVNNILTTLRESYDQLDDELRARGEAQDKMIELSEQVGRFQLTAGIFHDFNNLMQIAMSSVEIIKRRNPDVGVSNFFVKIERSLHMMANLVKAQQESAKRKDSASYHDLRELVEEALVLEEHNLVKSNVQVIVDIPPKFEAYVAKNLFLLVILNLIKNSREAFEQVQQESKLIWIKTWAEKSGDRWSISVTDNGPGVPKEFQTKLFMHGETTKVKGHGLGIASCKRAVQMYRGDLVFDEPFDNGEGARFTLTMPLAAEAHEHPLPDQEKKKIS